MFGLDEDQKMSFQTLNPKRSLDSLSDVEEPLKKKGRLTATTPPVEESHHESSTCMEVEEESKGVDQSAGGEEKLRLENTDSKLSLTKAATDRLNLVFKIDSEDKMETKPSPSIEDSNSIERKKMPELYYYMWQKWEDFFQIIDCRHDLISIYIVQKPFIEVNMYVELRNM